jgi:DNA-directed RNA polymerase sigma subunit (sigma70/sigma32)
MEFERAMTLDEVAAALGIDRSRVHQLERAGLSKMRAACEAIGLHPDDFVAGWCSWSAMDGNRRRLAQGGR